MIGSALARTETLRHSFTGRAVKYGNAHLLYLR